MLETPQWVPERHPHQGQGVGIRYQLGLAGSWVAPQLLFCASQASLQGPEHAEPCLWGYISVGDEKPRREITPGKRTPGMHGVVRAASGKGTGID